MISSDNFFHYDPLSLAVNTEKVAYLSIKRPKNLVIFVHGFKGTGMGTWSAFGQLLWKHEAFRLSDVVFYDYETCEYEATVHSSMFYEFLNDLILNCEKLRINGTSMNLPGVKYDNIVIVAHSLGALIARKAMLYAHRNGNDWLNRSKLALFAPAHHGAEPFDILNALISERIANIFLSVSLLVCPVINDLKPDSKFINALREETESLIGSGSCDFAKAQLVVHAAKDKVIDLRDYCQDAVPKFIRGKNHVTVCKPIEIEYLDPIDLVGNLLIA